MSPTTCRTTSIIMWSLLISRGAKRNHMNSITADASLWLLFGLGLKHLVVEAKQTQTPYMYYNKEMLGHPGGIMHALLHSVATCCVLRVWSLHYQYRLPIDTVLYVYVVETVWHYFTDYGRMSVIHRLKLTSIPTTIPGKWPQNAIRRFWWYWVVSCLDQFSHFCTYLVVILMVTSV